MVVLAEKGLYLIPERVLHYWEKMNFENTEFLDRICVDCYTTWIRLSYISKVNEEDESDRLIVIETCPLFCGNTGIHQTRDRYLGEKYSFEDFMRDIIKDGKVPIESVGRPRNKKELANFLAEAVQHWQIIAPSKKVATISPEKIADMQQEIDRCYR